MHRSTRFPLIWLRSIEFKSRRLTWARITRVADFPENSANRIFRAYTCLGARALHATCRYIVSTSYFDGRRAGAKYEVQSRSQRVYRILIFNIGRPRDIGLQRILPRAGVSSREHVLGEDIHLVNVPESWRVFTTIYGGVSRRASHFFEGDLLLDGSALSASKRALTTLTAEYVATS